MQNGNPISNKQQAMTVLMGTKAIANQYMAKDNKSEDKNPEKGAVHVIQTEDTTTVDAKVKFDPLPGQMGKLRNMSISYKHPNGEETIKYAKVPDSETEMISMKSTSEGKEVAVMVDEQKGIYFYKERPLKA